MNVAVWLHVYFEGTSDAKLYGFDTDEDALAFIVAQLNLHHAPGINPHSGNKALAIRAIHTAQPEKSRGYWWTDPKLQADAGAPFIRFESGGPLWTSHGCRCQKCDPALYRSPTPETPKCPHCHSTQTVWMSITSGHADCLACGYDFTVNVCTTCNKVTNLTRCWTCEKPDILINSISPPR